MPFRFVSCSLAAAIAAISVVGCTDTSDPQVIADRAQRMCETFEAAETYTDHARAHNAEYGRAEADGFNRERLEAAVFEACGDRDQPPRTSSPRPAVQAEEDEAHLRRAVVAFRTEFNRASPQEKAFVCSRSPAELREMADAGAASAGRFGDAPPNVLRQAFFLVVGEGCD